MIRTLLDTIEIFALILILDWIIEQLYRRWAKRLNANGKDHT